MDRTVRTRLKECSTVQTSPRKTHCHYDSTPFGRMSRCPSATRDMIPPHVIYSVAPPRSFLTIRITKIDLHRGVWRQEMEPNSWAVPANGFLHFFSFFWAFRWGSKLDLNSRALEARLQARNRAATKLVRSTAGEPRYLRQTNVAEKHRLSGLLTSAGFPRRRWPTVRNVVHKPDSATGNKLAPPAFVFLGQWRITFFFVAILVSFVLSSNTIRRFRSDKTTSQCTLTLCATVWTARSAKCA